jgi:serine/threonine-protein kinase RsbW
VTGIVDFEAEAGAAERIELRLDANPDNLVLARLALTGLAAVAGAPPNVVADLKVAVTEACTNAMQHAYPRGAGADPIVVRYAVSEGRITVEVEDSGVGFDPDAPPRMIATQHGEGGMGLLLIEALSDELEVTSDESGTCLVFHRRLDAER